MACRPRRPASHAHGARACEWGRLSGTVWKYGGITAAGQISQLPIDYTGSLMGQSIDARGSPGVTLGPLLSEQGTANNCTSLMLERVSNPRSGAACFFSGALGSDFTPVHA